MCHCRNFGQVERARKSILERAVDRSRRQHKIRRNHADEDCKRRARDELANVVDAALPGRA